MAGFGAAAGSASYAGCAGACRPALSSPSACARDGARGAGSGGRLSARFSRARARAPPCGQRWPAGSPLRGDLRCRARAAAPSQSSESAAGRRSRSAALPPAAAGRHQPPPPRARAHPRCAPSRSSPSRRRRRRRAAPPPPRPARSSRACPHQSRRGRSRPPAQLVRCTGRQSRQSRQSRRLRRCRRPQRSASRRFARCRRLGRCAGAAGRVPGRTRPPRAVCSSRSCARQASLAGARRGAASARAWRVRARPARRTARARARARARESRCEVAHERARALERRSDERHGGGDDGRRC